MIFVHVWLMHACTNIISTLYMFNEVLHMLNGVNMFIINNLPHTFIKLWHQLT